MKDNKMKNTKKIQANFERRQRGFASLGQNNTKGKDFSKGYTKPGSRNPKKVRS